MTIKRKSKAVINDGLRNAISELGTRKDKTTHSRFTTHAMRQQELLASYTDNWLAANIVDVPVEDGFRGGRYIQAGDLDVTPYTDLCADLDVDARFAEAAKLARLYGGALVLMVTDAPDFAAPMGANETVRSLVVFSRYDTSVNTADIELSDLRDPLYRMPKRYKINNSDVDESRVIRFDGVMIPWEARRSNEYWHGSIIKRVRDAVVFAQSTIQNLDCLINMASTDVFKTPNLASLVTNPQAWANAQDRFGLAAWQRSNNNMILLDSEEDYLRVAANFSGIPDTLTKSLQVVAGAARIPQTKLLGDAASGLNATGEGDLKNYYDLVEADRRLKYKPAYDKLDKALIPQVWRGGAPDYKWTFEPLWQMSDNEIADIQLKRAQRDQIYLSSGVVDPGIVARDLKACETYDGIDDEYIDALDMAVETRNGGQNAVE